MLKLWLTLAFLIIVFEEKRVIWVIEYIGSPRMWITDLGVGSIALGQQGPAFDVTFQFKRAKRFPNSEDARHEILHLGLSALWEPRQVGAI